NSPLSSLQYSDGMGAVSLSPSTDPELFKRMSYSESDLCSTRTALSGVQQQLQSQDEEPMVPFSSQSQSGMARSQVIASTHQRASSDTDSIAVARQQEG
ncbi:hypothetical protein M9458_042587, partial [Cirrhinus mrigala]